MVFSPLPLGEGPGERACGSVPAALPLIPSQTEGKLLFHVSEQ